MGCDGYVILEVESHWLDNNGSFLVSSWCTAVLFGPLVEGSRSRFSQVLTLSANHFGRMVGSIVAAPACYVVGGSSDPLYWWPTQAIGIALVRRSR